MRADKPSECCLPHSAKSGGSSTVVLTVFFPGIRPGRFLVVSSIRILYRIIQLLQGLTNTDIFGIISVWKRNIMFTRWLTPMARFSM